MESEGSKSVRRIPTASAEWKAEARSIARAMNLTAELNKLTFDEVEKARALFSELTGREVDDAFRLIPPFYTSGGLRIRVGRKVFINQCCTIYDMGGVDIGDRVMIGPNVNIITEGHAMDPAGRRDFVEARPIVIRDNVWIATGATILGGVTVGENSVVGAGAVVTKDVPPNSFAAGNPAGVIRMLGDNKAAGSATGGSRPG